MVAYEANSRPSLHKALTLGDALKDLPPVRQISPEVLFWLFALAESIKCLFRLTG
mgnify:CR=1 FL=1